jgi:hypothetical protein
MVQTWVESAGMSWPLSHRRTWYSSELVDIESGRTVMTLPFALDGAFHTRGGPLAVTANFDALANDEAPSVEVWDIPPRKSLTWFAAGAALLALPPLLIARRRVRRLRAVAS